MARKYRQLYIFLPALLILFAAAVFFMVKNYYSSDEFLWQYAPKKSLAFAEFDLADKNFIDYLGRNSQAKKQLEKFLQDNGLPADIWKAEIEIQKIGLFVVEIPDQEKRKEPGWVVKSRGNIEQSSAFLSGYYYQPIDKKTAIIARSKEVMQMVRGAQYFSDLNFGQRSKAVNGFGYGFFRAEFWDSTRLTDEEKRIFHNNLAADDQGLIYWQAAINDKEEINFQINLPWAYSDNKLAWQRDAMAGNIFYSDKSLVLKLDGVKNIWETIVAGAESETVAKEIVETYINDKYQTDIRELYTIFEQPVALVVRPKIKIKQASDLMDLGNNDFAIVSNKVFNINKDQVAWNLEALIKSYTAFKFPEKRLKILIDKTTGYEVVADPNRLAFTKENYGRGEIKFIKAADFEMGYFLGDEEIIIFNSTNLVKRILDQKEARAGGDELGDAISDLILDPAILDTTYLSFAKIVSVVFDDNERNGIVIKGMIK